MGKSKTGNGGSTPKVPAPSAEQDAQRRAVKAARRTGGKASLYRAPQDTLTAQIEQDKINSQGVKILDRFEVTMTSISKGANEQLRRAAHVYVDIYTSPSEETMYARHTRALEKALSELDTNNLRSYARAQINAAFYATRPPQ